MTWTLWIKNLWKLQIQGNTRNQFVACPLYMFTMFWLILLYCFYQPDVDMWIQTPRDLAILQSTSCYSLSGQAQTHPANMPGVNGANLGLNQAALHHLTCNAWAYIKPHNKALFQGKQITLSTSKFSLAWLVLLEWGWCLQLLLRWAPISLLSLDILVGPITIEGIFFIFSGLGGRLVYLYSSLSLFRCKVRIVILYSVFI